MLQRPPRKDQDGGNKVGLLTSSDSNQGGGAVFTEEIRVIKDAGQRVRSASGRPRPDAAPAAGSRRR